MAYRDLVLADGASHYWRLNEPSGTTAADLVGAAPGTISGGVTLAQPGATIDGDKAMTFDGATGHISVPNGPFLAFGTGPVSLECWMRTATPQAPWMIDCKGDGLAATPGIAFLLDAAPTLYFLVGNGTAIDYNGFTIPYANGQWHHVVGVVVRGATDKSQLYFDGLLLHEQALPWTGANLTQATRPAVFGSNGAANSDWYTGSLDEVAIYPVALTPAQIANHYAVATTASGARRPIAWGVYTSQFATP